MVFFLSGINYVYVNVWKEIDLIEGGLTSEMKMIERLHLNFFCDNGPFYKTLLGRAAKLRHNLLSFLTLKYVKKK